MATIDLTVQESIALSTGDILQLPAAEDTLVKIVFINVLGSASLRPASGQTINSYTSFDIVSSSATDTSTVRYLVIKHTAL